MKMGGDQVYEFEGFTLDLARRVFSDGNGSPIKLMPKAFDLLAFLVENNHRVVSKDEIMSELWPDTIVEENNLTQNISSLRRVFGEKPHENRFISTIPGRGYRFVAAVRKDEDAEGSTGKKAVDVHSARRSFSIVVAFASIAIIGSVVYFGFVSRTGTKQIRSLAVLPFKPLSPETRDEALELGMADSLISKLATGSELRVLPLTAVRGIDSQGIDPQSAGQRFGVDAVLDGVMQIAGNRIRVSTKLVRVSDGRQLWSGQFDEELRDIFSVQDSISRRVADALAVPLETQNEIKRTPDPEAYQLFMRGKYHAYKLVLSELQKGIAYYEQAISVDPNYAPPHVELANAYRAMVLTNDASPSEMMPRAKAAAAKALEIDENLAEAWTAQAFGNFWFDWDWQSAETNFRKALLLDPNSSQAHAYYAHLLSNIGRHEEAAREIRRAREIDPMNPLFSSMEGQILFFAGRESDSTVVLQSVIDLNPNFWLARLFICRNYLAKGSIEQALASANKAREITGGNAEATGTVGYILAKLGRTQESRRVLEELEGRKDRPFLAYATAQVHLGLGEKERALDQLERAFDQKEPLMVFLKVEPKWDELRSEPRFIALIERLNL